MQGGKLKPIALGVVVIVALLVGVWWLALPSDPPLAAGPCESGEAAQACQKACDDGDLMSCYRLGESLWYVGPIQDSAKAAVAYEKACALGWPEIPKAPEAQRALGRSCYLVGVVHESSKKEAAIGRTFAFFHRACAFRSGPGCTEIGRMYDSGLGAPKDRVEAHRYYALACEYGEKSACVMAARLSGKSN